MNVFPRMRVGPLWPIDAVVRFFRPRSGVQLRQSPGWLRACLRLVGYFAALACASAAIDIQPLSISLGSTSVVAGGSLTVSWQIKNNGSTAASSSNSQLRFSTSNASNGYASSGGSLGNVGSAQATGTVSAGGTASQSATVTVPSTPGTYYVWVIADNTSLLTQSNTTNDFAVSASFRVTSPTTVDVQPQNVSLSSTSVASGSSFTVSWQIKNNGSGTASSSNTQLRFSTSNAFNGYAAGSGSLGNVGSAQATGTIGAGGGANQSSTVTVPTTPGTYYVWVIADNASVLTQSNTSNDFAVSAAFTVTAPTTVDVQPQSINLSSSSISPGGALTVSWQIKNNGTGTALSSNSQLRFSTSNASNGYATGSGSLGNVGTAQATGTIAAGGSVSQSTTVTVPSTPGTYYVWVIADNSSALTQSNPNNDFAVSAAFTVPTPTIDVLPFNVALDKNSVSPGGAVTVSWRIENRGTGPAGTSNSQPRFSTSNATNGYSSAAGGLGNAGVAQPTGSIAAGATIDQSASLTAPTTPGTYYVWVIVDNTSLLTQSDGTNDFAVSGPLTVSAPSTVDIQPVNIVLGSTDLLPGGLLTVGWGMRNNGNVLAATSNTQLRLSTSNAANGYSGSAGSLGNVGTPQATGGIAAGTIVAQSTSLTVPTTPGTYYVWVIADNNSSLTQSDPNNDFAVSTAFTVTAAAVADLIPQNIALGASSVTAGGTLPIAWQIKNQGTATAGTSNTQLRISTSNAANGYSSGGGSLGNFGAPKATGSLAVGALIDQNTNVVVPTTPGTYYVWAIADNNSAVTQSNTDNDFAVSVAFTVVAAPGTNFQLNFPLAGFTAHTAPINSGFDHSLPVTYGKDGVVVVTPESEVRRSTVRMDPVLRVTSRPMGSLSCSTATTLAPARPLTSITTDIQVTITVRRTIRRFTPLPMGSFTTRPVSPALPTQRAGTLSRSTTATVTSATTST